MEKSQRVAPKRQRKTPATKPVEAISQIPKDLQDQWGAVEATATAFTLMQQAAFPHSHMKAVELSLGFLGKLHEQTLNQALEHPKAAMIPELKAVLDKRAGVADGETKAN